MDPPRNHLQDYSARTSHRTKLHHESKQECNNFNLASNKKRKNPEIIEIHGGRIVRPSGRKDRHSKVFTARGARDRRVRLSPETAIQFYDVQDRLGCDRPSKAIDWLMQESKAAIDALELQAARKSTAQKGRHENDHWVLSEELFVNYESINYLNSSSTILDNSFLGTSYPIQGLEMSMPLYEREPLQSSVISYSTFPGIEYADCELSTFVAAGPTTLKEDVNRVSRTMFSEASFHH